MSAPLILQFPRHTDWSSDHYSILIARLPPGHSCDRVSGAWPSLGFLTLRTPVMMGRIHLGIITGNRLDPLA